MQCQRRHRAVTLIEAVLYISVALALIVGGLVFFQQASTAARTSAMVRQLSAVVAETRVLIKGQPLNTVVNTNFNVSDTLDITAFLISAGAVPSDMVASATTLSNPFGGTTTVNAMNVAGLGPVMFITSTRVPKGVCARLLTSSSSTQDRRATTPVSSGYIFGGAMASGAGMAFQNFSMNATEAGWMCRYGAASYTVQNIQPNAQSITGDVDVFMMFVVEA
jgi:hypothetical protein